MSGKRNVKTKSKNDRRETDATETVLRRLARAPETAHQIYELAESLYQRNGDEVETDDELMKKQFAELATLTSEFHPPEIPVGF